MKLSTGDLLSKMETVQTMQYREAMIDRLRGGLGRLIQLIADVVEQNGFGDLGQRAGRVLLPPAGEMQQIISVGAQRTQGELANMLRILGSMPSV
jgi:hypothetical protein